MRDGCTSAPFMPRCNLLWYSLNGLRDIAHLLIQKLFGGLTSPLNFIFIFNLFFLPLNAFPFVTRCTLSSVFLHTFACRSSLISPPYVHINTHTHTHTILLLRTYFYMHHSYHLCATNYCLTLSAILTLVRYTLLLLLQTHRQISRKFIVSYALPTS